MSAFGETYSANSKIIKEQNRQAKSFEKREQDRQARITYGNSLIDALFDGGTVAPQALGASAKYDPKQTYYISDGKGGFTEWSPTAETPTAETPAAPASGGSGGAPAPRAQRNWYIDPDGDYREREPAPYQNGKPTFYYDTDGDFRQKPSNSSGNDKKKGGALSAEEQFAALNGKVYDSKGVELSGIGEDFYSAYQKAILDYQLPQLTEQYEKARSNDLFYFANRGTARSTMANQQAADRLKESTVNEGALRSGAQQQVDQLKGDVRSAKGRAKNTLYQTESPTAGANAALTEANAVTSRAPALSPLGTLFEGLSYGVQGFRNARDDAFYKGVGNPAKPTGSGSGRVLG